MSQNSRRELGIHDNYFVVDEKAINFFKLNFSSCWTKILSDVSLFASLEHTIGSASKVSISDTGNVLSSEPLAEIIFWKWEQGTQLIKQNIVLQKGSSVQYDGYLPISVVIRFLKKRQLVKKWLLYDNLFLFPASFWHFFTAHARRFVSPGDDLTVRIGDRQLTVSAHWLMSVSPMVKRMLSVDMKEKRERVLNLDGHGITMEQFIEFMGAISATSFRHPFFPNPKNVLTFLWFADYFQIDWLKERCGVHLANCVEIPFSERFLLIERL